MGLERGAGKSRKQKTVKTEPTKKEEPAKKEEEKKPEVKLPDHPLLENLDDKSLRELAHIRSMLFFPRTKLQLNRQIAEMVVVEITIDADAEPGSRELRLGTRVGVTNPVVFQVTSNNPGSQRLLELAQNLQNREFFSLNPLCFKANHNTNLIGK